MPIPLGAGKFLSQHDLAAWRAANPDEPLGRGQRELIEGRSFQAIQLFNKTLGEDPENTEALLWRGKAFESVGNLQKALADYQRILSFDAENSAALSRLDGLRASPPPGAAVPEMPEAQTPKNSPSRATTLIPE
jgi:tetratricopeptide (TPR) repeat protein